MRGGGSKVCAWKDLNHGRVTKNSGSAVPRRRSPAGVRPDDILGAKRVFYHSITDCSGVAGVSHCL